MADEFQSGICSGNWWNSERIISTTGGGGVSLPYSTASSDVINIGGGGAGGNNSNYGGGGGGGWQQQEPQQQHHQMKAAISCRSSDESGGASVTCSSSVVFQDTNNNTQKPQESDSIGGGCVGSGNSILMDSTLQMMGYGLSSSPSMDWNPSLLNNNPSSSSGRSDHNNFGCMLQEDLTSPRTTTTTSIYRHHQEPGSELVLKDWSPKNFSSSCSTTTADQDSSSVVNGTNFQQQNLIQQGSGFSLDHHHHHHPSNNHLLNSTTSSSECTVTCDQGLHTSFPILDHSSTLYGCPSSLLQGLFEPDYHSSTTPHSQSSLPSMTNNYFMNTNDQLSSPTWPIVAPKLPRHQYLKNTTTITTTSSPPKQVQQPTNNNNQLHFSNNARFWNANSAAAMNNSRSSFFPSQQIQLLTPTSFEDKPNCSNQNTLKNKADSSSVVKKSSSNEPSFKRPRVETPSPLPTFKVRKEKLGDRITALQQLVSPFGKTDTASVLFEAIEYIKFLHDQVTVLSAPYLKNGAHIQHHQQMQNSNKTKESQGSITEKDLRSRGLCLVPISSTFPVTNETATDFWTPTFGGTYR